MEKNYLTAGYVIQHPVRSSRFLSRSGRFVRHSNRSRKLGLERAWVHSVEGLLKCKDGLIPDDAILYPAKYSHETGYTGVGGNSVTYEKFLEIHQPMQVA